MDEDPESRKATTSPPKHKSGAEKPPDRGRPHAKRPDPPSGKKHPGNPGPRPFGSPVGPVAPKFTGSGAKDRSDMGGYRGKAGT